MALALLVPLALTPCGDVTRYPSTFLILYGMAYSFPAPTSSSAGLPRSGALPVLP